MNAQRVYDSYVDHPLLLVHKITGTERYRETAVKNLDWIINQKQHENGWLEDCDNTLKHNNKPITHTIAYTVDGLLECGLILKDEHFINAAKKAADVLLADFIRKGFLNGRYDQHWNGSEYMICTGSAQLAIIWLKLYPENVDTRGALPGSFPFWGKYEPFAFPNWGTKYLADSLMLEIELSVE